MQRSISSLTYNGSIPEAIIEAQRQSKLFVVYISGDDEDSVNLEQSTWVDLSVADAFSKKCVFLHLINGTVDASQFCAIFPQKSIPSISAVGYNGVMLWTHEGYINAENLVQCIDKAWASLLFQETAATLLTATFASRKTEPSDENPENLALHALGSSPSPDNPSTSTQSVPQDLEDLTFDSDLVGKQGPACKATLNEEADEHLTSGPSNGASSDLGCSSSPSPSTSVGEKPQHLEERAFIPELMDDDHETEKNVIGADEDSSQSFLTNDVKMHKDTEMRPINEMCRDFVVQETSDAISSYPDSNSFPEQNNIISSVSHETTVEAAESVQMSSAFGSSGGSSELSDKIEERTQDGKTNESISNPKLLKSTDVHLHIRLPNGSFIQAKFSNNETLRLVKKYVAEDQKSSLSFFDLAVPYPRKVFGDEDMDKALSELGFANREALIVTPRRDASRIKRSTQSSHESVNIARTRVESLDNTNEGYFEYLKRIISYINPFSYIGRATGSASGPMENGSTFRYRSNPASQDNLSNRESSYSPFTEGPSTSDNSFKVRKHQSTSSRSNVHTLRDVEDDDPSDDKNMYWNGNSTQFGGDDKK